MSGSLAKEGSSPFLQSLTTKISGLDAADLSMCAIPDIAVRQNLTGSLRLNGLTWKQFQESSTLHEAVQQTLATCVTPDEYSITRPSDIHINSVSHDAPSTVVVYDVDAHNAADFVTPQQLGAELCQALAKEKGAAFQKPFKVQMAANDSLMKHARLDVVPMDASNLSLETETHEQDD